jgi:predicted ATP-grasp superfamily ATP-dependent carboligase/RimJ/RimL family protein N-acetyltransferase
MKSNYNDRSEKSDRVPTAYSCMPQPVLRLDSLWVQAVQPSHIENIRQWRNAQMDILRQSVVIQPEEQARYFQQQIWPDLLSPHPQNILLAYMEGSNLIGYGGLVHIAWAYRRAEVSFLLNNDLAGTPSDYQKYFPRFLQLMQVLAFDELNLDRLCTETYSIRKEYIAALEFAGFDREGILRQHVRIKDRPIDSFMHGCLKSNYCRKVSQISANFGNLLITSASKKVSLVKAAQRACRKLSPEVKLVAGDSDKNALTRYVADDFWQMPPTNDLKIDLLISGCQERNIRTVIPTRDGELIFWASHQSRLAEEGINVLVSPLSSVRVCVDKLAFYQFGLKHNLPFIPTAIDPDEIKAEFYVVKERYGAGSNQIGLNLTKEAAIQHALQLTNPIYQAFIPGKEISVDAWLDRFSKVKGLVLRSRDLIIGGEAQVTTTFQNAAIESTVLKVLETLNLRGHVVLQALIDNDDRLHIIECNSRFGGASTASIEVGLDSFYWSLLESAGVDLNDYQFERKASETRQIRVPSDIYINL